MSCRVLSAQELGVLGRTLISMRETEVPDFDECPRARAILQDTARDLFRLSRANVRAFRVCYDGRHWQYALEVAPSRETLERAIRDASPDVVAAVEAACMLHCNTADEVALKPSEWTRLGSVMSTTLAAAVRACRESVTWEKLANTRGRMLENVAKPAHLAIAERLAVRVLRINGAEVAQ
jgi:hypothetical protein